MFSRIRNWYNNLPEQKKKLEFITALLSIPVLVTVIASNILNIKIKQSESKPSDSNNKTTTIIVTQTPQPEGKKENPVTVIPIEVTSKPQSTDSKECKKDIGEISITSPKEGEIVKDDPVCIAIEYKQGDYCSVVWSYRIDNSKWSDYGSNLACYNNLESGKHQFELRVKSVAADKEITLTRSFEVKKDEATPSLPSITNTPTPTLSPSISPS